MRKKKFNIIATICARGGSKGIKNKNIRTLHGKPLIAYTIETAKESKLFSTIVLSTDSENILKIGKDFGVEAPFLRPAELANDYIPKFSSIKHAVLFMEEYKNEHYDIIVDLDPTSPLRTISDLEGCINKLIDTGADSIITGYKAYKNPYFNMLEINKSGYVGLSKSSEKPIFRRQDAPSVYAMNASIYVMWKDLFLNRMNFITDKTMLYLMPEERSIDIDREIDFKFIEFLLEYNGRP
jgi:CMP-N-acetylneuraminic acid synthetase